METLKNNKSGNGITFEVPCLNEEANIIKTINTILEAAHEVGVSYEIIIIDDNSSDRTVAVIEDYQYKNPTVPIKLKKNTVRRGLGHNYVEGAFMGEKRYYMTVFGDNSEPKETIKLIIEEMGKADMIIPYFGKNESRCMLRRIISKTFVVLVNLLAGNKLKYYNGPVLHKRYNVMRWHSDALGYAYQAEIITRLLIKGTTYIEVEVSNYDRESGVSKAFNLQNYLSVTHSLVQIYFRRIRWLFFKV